MLYKSRDLFYSFKVKHRQWDSINTPLTMELILMGSFLVPSERYLRGGQKNTKIHTHIHTHKIKTKKNKKKRLIQNCIKVVYKCVCMFMVPLTQSPLQECRWGELQKHSTATGHHTPMWPWQRCSQVTSRWAWLGLSCCKCLKR